MRIVVNFVRINNPAPCFRVGRFTNLNKMTIEQFAEQNGFVKLTSSNHPENGQTVEILGACWSKDYNIEKVTYA